MAIKKKLAGINRLLKTIGEPPLQNEDDFQLSYEATLAESQIDETSATVLSEGFKFNTVESVKLLPDVNGVISIPPRALIVEFVDDNITVMDGLVFDTESFSNIFEQNTSVEAKIIYNSDFEYIPMEIQEFILAEASYIFQRDKVNESSMNNELRMSRDLSLRKLNIWKIRKANANAKDSRFQRNANPSNT